MAASCAACRTLPEEGLLSRHLFFYPSVVLSEAIDIKTRVPDVKGDDDLIEVYNVASLDDVFVSGFSHSRASTAMVVPREKPRRMADPLVPTFRAASNTAAAATDAAAAAAGESSTAKPEALASSFSFPNKDNKTVWLNGCLSPPLSLVAVGWRPDGVFT